MWRTSLGCSVTCCRERWSQKTSRCLSSLWLDGIERNRPIPRSARHIRLENTFRDFNPVNLLVNNVFNFRNIKGPKITWVILQLKPMELKVPKFIGFPVLKFSQQSPYLLCSLAVFYLSHVMLTKTFQARSEPVKTEQEKVLNDSKIESPKTLKGSNIGYPKDPKRLKHNSKGKKINEP